MEEEKIDMSTFKTVREVMEEKKKRINSILPAKRSAQKEFIRDWLARKQDKFEECMDQLAEYDPKTFATIYKDLTKHMIPKQSEVSVTHGLDEDFKQLAAMSMTKISSEKQIDLESVQQIHDADFEELKCLDNGTGEGL